MKKVNLKHLQEELSAPEKEARVFLDPNKLIAIRLDMRSGGSFVKNLIRPWDYVFTGSMNYAAKVLLEEVSGAVATFVGSDEITLVMYPKTESDKWNGGEIPFFNGRTDKILSLTSSIVTNAFNEKWFEFMTITTSVRDKRLKETKSEKEAEETFETYDNRLKILKNKLFKAQFDARVFQPDGVPSEEAIKIIFSRMNDVKKNSIQMLAREHFSHKELQGKTTGDQKQMLLKENILWEEVVVTDNKYGAVFFREKVLKKSLNNLTKEEVLVKRNVIQQANPSELFQFVDARTYEELFSSTLATRITKKES